MSLLIAFVVLSISVSFICSILEAALLSITPSYIAQQKLLKPKLYEKLKQLKEKIDQPLAAILTLNTVAHTVGATGVGAQVTIVFGDGYLGIASAVMTLLILILSEIVPKTIGARYWPSLVPVLPTVLNTMILLLKPFIWMSDQVMKLFGGGQHELDLRQEIKALTILGRELNKLDENEQRVISNILDLHEIKVRDIMTPRTVCDYAKPDELLADLVKRAKKGQYSRYPILDHEEAPIGIVFRYDMLDYQSGQTASDIKKPVKVISDKMNVEQLMSQLIREQQHMALVYDEYGSWMGLVTMEDVFEAIIGQPIMDETDNIPNLRRFAKRRWENKQKQLEEMK
ncbi:CNNM domain-containing protein [Alishewanella sp. SMS8]|uniref:CNNM domain-containing protein n=1 Tax=Alishewanella sp. SMS8 TaxID=2994676 RepID=UPI002740564B|nr:CNNM domain-containing protein [Alishewanella sp. SMS8]MDP5034880.1 CNNM domain-containing protein [Alishewanella sp.]MDP5186040.1 CNNM domain-containing protein [Alishewanella sp.]MDP5457899.1 CNNM domain-containing protein [Alishewanella sp. SMS8]